MANEQQQNRPDIGKGEDIAQKGDRMGTNKQDEFDPTKTQKDREHLSEIDDKDDLKDKGGQSGRVTDVNHKEGGKSSAV